MIATVMEPAGIIEPIEISRSPAIIRRPIGKATMPRLAATFSQLAAPVGFRKSTLPKIRKKTKTPKRPRKAPAAGLRKSPPTEKLETGGDVCVVVTAIG